MEAITSAPCRWVTLAPAQAGQARPTSAASPLHNPCSSARHLKPAAQPQPSPYSAQSRLESAARPACSCHSSWHGQSANSSMHDLRGPLASHWSSSGACSREQLRPLTAGSLQDAACSRSRRAETLLSATGKKQKVDAYLEDLQEAAAEQSGEEGLTLGERSYHSIKLEGCDLLIGSTNDGRLDLNDAFVQDDDTGIFAEPQREGDMPTGSLYFQEIPWELESFGDILYDKPRWKKIHKVYLIAVQALGDNQDEEGYRAGFRLNLDMVYVLDHETRMLSRCEVERRTQNSGENDQILRIRDGSLTVESPEMLESEEEVVFTHEMENEIKDRESAIASTRTALEEDSEQPQDPMELMGDDFDEPDDIPAVDMQ